MTAVTSLPATQSEQYAPPLPHVIVINDSQNDRQITVHRHQRSVVAADDCCFTVIASIVCICYCIGCLTLASGIGTVLGTAPFCGNPDDCNRPALQDGIGATIAGCIITFPFCVSLCFVGKIFWESFKQTAG